VAIPTATMQAVERLVGVEHAAMFLTLAAEREVRARLLDGLSSSHGSAADLDERR
jgi:hypothetical protein